MCAVNARMKKEASSSSYSQCIKYYKAKDDFLPVLDEFVLSFKFDPLYLWNICNWKRKQRPLKVQGVGLSITLVLDKETCLLVTCLCPQLPVILHWNLALLLELKCIVLAKPQHHQHKKGEYPPK